MLVPFASDWGSFGGSGFCSAAFAMACGAAKTTSNTNVVPAPSLRTLTCPARVSPSAEPLRVASRGEFIGAEGHKIELVAQPLPRSRPRLDELTVRSKYRRGRIAVFEQTARPLGQGKLFAGAFGRHHQHGRSDCRVSLMREHRQIRVPPKLAPKPRSRSNRGAPPCGKVPARRAICTAATWRGSNSRAAIAPGEGASKIAAPVGFAQRMRSASALQSQTGAGLSACAASCGSRKYLKCRSDSVIAVSHKLRLMKP